MQGDLIAAIATPAGAGGIGIARASGSGIGALAALLERKTLPPPRLAARSRFIDDKGEVIDDGLAIFFPAPASFTGEDVLELHGHGGLHVMQRLLARCLQLGARQAAPGEFTLRAYHNSKLDLAQAEALADLISAGSEAAAAAAARSLTGAFSDAVAALTRQLRGARAALESDLDFSDEDARAPDAAANQALLPALAAQISALLAAAQQGAQLTAGADVLILGAPNVGKSSLLNRLAEEDAAIVSDTPGATRDLIERQIVMDGIVLRLTDTAGLRDTAAAVEQEGIRRARKRLQSADIVLRLAAPDAPPPPLPPGARARRLEVHNKIDLSGAPPGEKDGVYYLSAKTGAGLAALRAGIIAAAGGAPADSAFSARARHVAALRAAQEYIQRAQPPAAPEVAAAWLAEADKQLQSLCGGYNEEDLLGDIFSAFCIGK